VVSVQNGALNYYLHTENGRTLAAAVLPDHSQLYGRVSLRMRADAVPGYKTAFLYWPDSEVWPRDGEIDYPEGNLTGTIDAFMHWQNATNGSQQDWYGTKARYTDWHTYTIEWTPAAVEFFLDGQSIGRSTANIPNTPMHFVLQAERCLDGCAAPATAAGNLQIDWIAMWDYVPGVAGPVHTATTAAPTFSDLGQATPAERAAVEELAARGIILGCDQATKRFCPNESVLRVQMAALVVRSLGWGKQPVANPFTDRGGLNDELWGAVAILADKQVTKGVGNQQFAPFAAVSEAQVISLVTRALVTQGVWQPQAVQVQATAPAAHQQDIATYSYYTGQTFTSTTSAAWNSPASRVWTSQILWLALQQSGR
jgi:hypothetical protein